MESLTGSVPDPLRPQPSGNVANASGLIGGEGWALSGIVQERAAVLGLSPRGLRRYSAQGLLAQCRQRGLGHGHGTASYYPRRALDQVEAIAAARPHRISPMRLRHLVERGVNS